MSSAKIVVSTLLRGATAERIIEETARRAVRSTTSNGTTDIEVSLDVDGTALVRLFRRDRDGIRRLVASARVEGEEVFPPRAQVRVMEDSDVHQVEEAAEPIPLIHR
ncbi:MAG TPA: hypothetical protein VGE02_00075 [Gemmatimonadales bacterium]